MNSAKIFWHSLALVPALVFGPILGQWSFDSRLNAAELVPGDSADWPLDDLDWKTSRVDLSFLNNREKPAGKHGFLQAVKDQLVFEDGTVARFWGTNITAATLFGTRLENVKLQARRLSALGFNLVRLHHHDSSWVDPNIFGDKKLPDSRNLNSGMLKKLDWWIKCLKDEGIYVWLDLHVGRQFKAGDGIDGFEEISKGKPLAELKGYNYVNASIKEAMQRFNEAYVNHVNFYTRTRNKAEPAIVAMLLTNENDVTSHFSINLLPDKGVPKHNAAFMAKAETFADKYGLPRNRTWRSWEHGPSKLFLNDLEHRFNLDMIAHLHAQGVKVPIVSTSAWGGPISSLPALTAGSIIDAHSYGRVGELERNPNRAANLVHWIAAAHVSGRPLSVTEWNVEPFPVPDRHTIPLYLAASASFQGWGALMQYAYSQVPLNSAGHPSNWHAYNDPSLIATLPAAALLYRQRHVMLASTTYAFAPSADLLFNSPISPDNSVALRTAAEKGRLVIVLPETKELTWLKSSEVPNNALIVKNPDQSFLDANASEVISDTGELTRNWAQGTFLINSPLTQAAMGKIGGRTIGLSDVRFEVATQNATVAVQSLDGKSISKSNKIMISLAARAEPQAGNGMPFRSEPVKGRLLIRAPKGLNLYSDHRTIESDIPYKRHPHRGMIRRSGIPVPYVDGHYVVNIDKSQHKHWLFLN